MFNFENEIILASKKNHVLYLWLSKIYARLELPEYEHKLSMIVPWKHLSSKRQLIFNLAVGHDSALF
jgi:hypothetical protein